jgi:LCP family protein required for cell wall assembly
MPAMSRSSVRAFLGRYVISLAVAASLMIGGVMAVNRGIDDRVHQIRRIHLEVAAAPPQGANFLIIGSDTRSFVSTPGEAQAFGDAQTVEGQRSDTLMVAHVEPDAQRSFVVSFPRDLMVNVPGIPGKSRINEAYATGGPDLVIKTLKDNFDVDINHYLEVDFKSFQAVVNAIGSVTVYLPGGLRDDESGLSTPLGPGCRQLDGNAALAYVRSRTLEIYDPNGPIVTPDGKHWRLLDIRADLDRIPRQQAFMRKLAGLAIQKSLGDPFLALDLADRVLGYVQADQNLSRGDVNALIRAFRTVNVNDPNAIQFETLPVDPDPDNPGVTLVPSADADAVIAQLRTFGDNTPKSPTVLPSQVTVKVAEGSSHGYAPAVTAALNAQGFHAALTKAVARGVGSVQIRYAPDQTAAAKALLDYVPEAELVPSASAAGGLELVLGATFSGAITIPPTTTTVPTTAPPTGPKPPSTTQAPTELLPAVDPCPQQ